MVVGLEKAKEILKQDEALDAYLIYTRDDGEIKTFVTEGIASHIKKYNAEN
jgi:hypothetical protein